MICAMYDYLNYRFRLGRYGDDISKNLMAMGYLGGLPDLVVDAMENGDCIFTQKLNSIYSWGTMYLTQSDCDHCCVYIGNRQILHMTLGGSRVHDLEKLDNHTRILPLKMIMPDGGAPYAFRDKEYSIPDRKTPQAPFVEPEMDIAILKSKTRKAKRHLRFVAAQIQVGIMPECFSKSIFFDNIIIGFSIGLLVSYLSNSFIGLFLGAAYVLIGPISQFIFMKRYKAGLYVRPTTKLKNRRLGLIANGALVIPDWSKIPRDSIKAVYREKDIL